MDRQRELVFPQQVGLNGATDVPPPICQDHEWEPVVDRAASPPPFYGTYQCQVCYTVWRL